MRVDRPGSNQLSLYYMKYKANNSLKLLLSAIFVSGTLLILQFTAFAKPPSITIKDLLDKRPLKQTNGNKLWHSNPDDISKDSNYWRLFHEDSGLEELSNIIKHTKKAYISAKNPECATYYPKLVKCTASFRPSSKIDKRYDTTSNLNFKFLIPHANYREHAKHGLISEFNELSKKLGKEVFSSSQTINSILIEVSMNAVRDIKESKLKTNYCYANIHLPRNSKINITSKNCVSTAETLKLVEALDIIKISNFLLGPYEVTGEKIIEDGSKLTSDTDNDRNGNDTGRKRFIKDLLDITGK